MRAVAWFFAGAFVLIATIGVDYVRFKSEHYGYEQGWCAALNIYGSEFEKVSSSRCNPTDETVTQ